MPTNYGKQIHKQKLQSSRPSKVTTNLVGWKHMVTKFVLFNQNEQTVIKEYVHFVRLRGKCLKQEEDSVQQGTDYWANTKKMQLQQTVRARIKIQIFWNVALCKLVKSYLRSEGVGCLHLQGQTVKEERWTT
jgi:FMN-dependent NADH-azoreductase